MIIRLPISDTTCLTHFHYHPTDSCTDYNYHATIETGAN